MISYCKRIRIARCDTPGEFFIRKCGFLLDVVKKEVLFLLAPKLHHLDIFGIKLKSGKKQPFAAGINLYQVSRAQS